jgi:hypothetical protein
MNVHSSRPAGRAVSFGLVALATILLAAPAASADDAADVTPKMAEAQADFDEIDQSLATASGQDCTTMCKALQSLARAAERICALAQSGDEADKKRCADAKARLEEAAQRVRMACPGCTPTPPSAPPVDTVSAKKTESPVLFATEAAPSPGAEYERRSRRVLSATLAPLRLFLPVYLVKGALELAPVDRLSLAIAGGFGRFPAAASGAGSVSVSTVGAQLRGYFAGGFSGGGLFVGVDGTWAHASSALGTRTLVPGFTVGPVAGFKLVVGPGFTVETHLGVGIVVSDDRSADDPHDRVVPIWDVRAGWTF